MEAILLNIKNDIEKQFRIFAKIDLDALAHNVALIKSHLPVGTRLAAIIKADAYGHGAVEIARALENDAAYFGVADVSEGLELRRAGITTPVLVLGYTPEALFDKAIGHDITLTVFDYDNAAELSKAAQKAGKAAKIHIAVDTGMSRIGFQVTDSDADVAKKIPALPGILVEGIFSHYSTSDAADKTEAERQHELFDKFVGMLAARGVNPPLKHLNNSAGIMEMPSSFYDMARAGIILYGLYPSDEVAHDTFPLSPVLELISYITHVKTIPSGRAISYGRTFITRHDTVVATVSAGYGDGYPRAQSNIGKVIIGGKICLILGRVCMDQFMVDVTGVPGVCVGDRVTLIGHDGDEFISVEEVAAPAASFNYELICNIGRRVPRVYYKDGAAVRFVSYLN